MWWFPVQDWRLWVSVVHSFGSPLAEAWIWPPNPSSLRVIGCIYAPLRNFTVCRVKNLPASVALSTSGSNNITAHLTCGILRYFNVGCLFWPIHFGRYSEYVFQVHGLTGLLMLGSTPLILLAIYFLPKLNLNFIPKEIKLRISCISSGLYHVWCHITVETNLTFSFCPVLPTRGLENKHNSKTITSCKDKQICCWERRVNTIQDWTAETWVDYCQLGEDY